MNVNTFRNMSYGLYVVSSLDGDRPVGCIANSIMQITASPATVAVSLNHDNYTNDCVAKTGKFAFSILSEKSEPSIIGGFGFRSSRDNDKFAEVPHVMKEGLPVLTDACGYVVCKVLKTMETETHTVFLGEVIDADVLDESAPAMTYAYYHNVIKGTSPKNAPTFLQEDKPAAEETAVEEPTAEKKVGRWQCQVCGYIYEGEALPKDYTCPICGQGADKFMKIE